MVSFRPLRIGLFPFWWGNMATVMFVSTPPKKNTCYKMAKWPFLEIFAELEAVFHFNMFFEGMALASNGWALFFFWWRSRWLARNMFCCWSKLKRLVFQRFPLVLLLKNSKMSILMAWICWPFYGLYHGDSSPFFTTIWENTLRYTNIATENHYFQ